MDRLPPQDLEAERFVLGAFIREPGIRSECAQTLAADDFYADVHQRAWTICAGLYRAGKPIDVAIVANEVRARGWLDDLPYGALAEFLEAAPTATGWEQFAARVSALSKLRRLIHGTTEILSSCYATARDADDAVCDLQRLAFQLGESSSTRETRHLRSVVDETMREIDASSRDDSPTNSATVASGLRDLDDITGGFHAGELCLLAARPSVGKTALGVQIALHAASIGVPGIIFSLEQSRGELARRIMAGCAEVNSQNLRAGRLSAGDFRRIGEVVDALRELPLWINDSPTHRILSLSSVARGLRASQGLGLIVVDYLQLVTADDKRAKPHEQTEQLCKGLKLLARELEVPVICLTQLNRNLEHRGEAQRPRLSDLRDAGEQPADTVIALWRAHERNDDACEVVNATVLKQRNGPVGEVAMMYQKSRLKFQNAATEWAN